MDTEDEEAARLGERLRREAQRYAAPPGLSARVLASVRDEPAAAVPRKAPFWATRWFAPALSAAFSVVVAAGFYLAWPGAEERLADEVFAGHVRSLMTGHATDVASSDHHTVKPWFTGKLDFSPPVHDLTAQGFALVGGRLDYLDRRAVAALVYRHRQHFINLFVWPAAAEAPLRQLDRQGYHLVSWTAGGMTWWAVSDLNAQELAQFRATLEQAKD